MAIPEELLDELLSGHLDDALSGDERARIEQLLRDDANVQARFDSLRQQRRRVASAKLPAPKLPKSFSDSVIEAAMLAAEEESLADTHPLVRLKEASAVALPTGSHSPTQRFSTPQVIAVVVGLAATIILAVIAFRDASSDPSVPRLSDNGAGDHAILADNAAATDGVLDQGTASNENAVPDPDASDRMVDVAVSDPSVEKPKTNETPQSVATATDSVGTERIAANVPGVMRVADSGTGSDSTTDTVSQESPMGSLPFLLIVEVRPTEVGQQNDAIDQAMVRVAIQSGEERQVDEPLVLAIAEKRKADTEARSDLGVQEVLFLEAPARKLDRLVNHWVADREGIESVGFSMLNDAPVLRSVDSVRAVDSRSVRHSGRCWPIVGRSDDTFSVWSDHLGDRQFAPIRSENPVPLSQLASPLSPDKGPDVMANLLIIVRTDPLD